ncbi:MULTISPECIES: hypothetical protein [unclassified Sphingobacterium]|uniref:hypothetical protein n=1 Tax=unclassified Sphingobacterium TaxID=2609468 RepID=UPI001048A964|nr:MULTISPECIES: hypothetical protein [unclassified Sphingobacterium]MCS3555037.1 hypothetical protein [Sphingobacterium sp. JUb21]TCR05566.1 hypothetical protein EDF66_10633 [Sphingobacterium sp. JUb20]
MKKNRLFGYCTLAAVLISSCKDSPSIPEVTETIPSKYSVWVATANGSYLLTTDEIMKDTLLSPANNKGVDITGNLPQARYAGYAYVFNGSYYLSNDGTRFSKHQLTDGGEFKEVDNYAFPSDFYLGKVASQFSTTDEIVFTSTGASDANLEKKVFEKDIYFMNTKDMTLNKTLKAQIPTLDYTVYKPDGSVDPTILNVTSMRISGGKAYFGFFYYNVDYKPVNTKAYAYICDYPSMANGHIMSDDRASYVAGHWQRENYSFLDDDNNLYLLTRGKTDGTYAILRVNNGQTEFDKSYLYDLKDYAVKGGDLAWLGDGKAYIRPYVIDVANKKIIANLAEMTGGDPTTTINLIENGNLYTAVKTPASKWFIYEYNIKNNSVKKGAEIDPGVTQVYHINKLK